MDSDYDVIVLGAGSSGEHCAGALADGGSKVAVVERELVGGECSYWACIPSKTLLRPGETLAGARAAPGAAEAVRDGLDPTAVLAWRDSMVSGHHDDGQVKWLAENGIDLLRGSGRIAETGVVEIDGRRHTAREIVIATGSAPAMPPIPGLDELDGVWTNREATAAEDVPETLVILGGGPVGVELAQAFAALGSDVDLVEGDDRLLPNEPRPLGDALAKALSSDRLRIHLGKQTSEARRHGSGYRLGLEGGGEISAERLLIATGRRPRVQGIGLERVGIEPREEGISVDARMRAADGVWAIGDVTGIWPLTYVGKYQGRIAAANIAGQRREADYSAVPRVVFTHPQAAAVGDSEGSASATIPLASVPRTATYMRETDDYPGFLTLISDGEVLTGAYGVGPEAGEWMQQATLAIRGRVRLDVLLDTIQPFPSFSEAFFAALAEL